MRNLAVFACILVTGCASSPQEATKNYLEKDKEFVQTCFGEVAKLPHDAQLAVNRTTGRSPFTEGMACYGMQLKAYANMSDYPHKTLLYSFADYGVQIHSARDRGVMDMKTANDAYVQTAKIFVNALSQADAKIATRSRQDVADRIAAFGNALSAVTLEQDRQRRANRPVTCHLTGIYVHNSVICN